MTHPDRRVRHLRLRANSQTDVGRVLPVLEDALRCASLPDTGSRLLLVRRLALGRIARDANAQALAQVIEQRVAAVGGQWVDGGTPAAAGAAYVSFAGALEARTRLALRLARGEAHTEWYWPLAVPELRAAEGRRDALRRMAWAIAQWPEARTALPAWVAALVQAGQGAALVGAIPASDGEALVRQAGLSMRHEPPRDAMARPDGLPPASGQAGPAQRVPRWMRCLLGSAPPPRAAPGVRAVPSALALPAPDPAAKAPSRHASGAGPADTKAWPARDAVQAVPAGAARPAATGREPSPHRPVSQAALPTPREQPPPAAGDGRPALPLAADHPGAQRMAGPWQAGRARPRAQPVPRPHLDAQATAFGGLLFLLPVLERLGLAQWLADEPAPGFAPRVLDQALRRLCAPEADPAWVLASADASGAPARPVPAPACWSDPLLRASRPSPSLAQALAGCASAEAQAAVWLTGARRWLRRCGHIGLASLVRRPGLISLTPTHADLHFRLQDTDLRVRRLGLDLDPGWLPWFGRVVAFHYTREGA
ncbi:MAG TPA: hypothetical protein VFL86_21855 [Burkholderiaceae bacterium]|nr:hypothetical protein [Burkholderiaceae bacterium]